jgi:hypothetical protein
MTTGRKRRPSPDYTKEDKPMSNHDGIDPTAPTGAPPGSPERERVLSARAAAGLPLVNPRDSAARVVDADGSTSCTPPAGPRTPHHDNGTHNGTHGKDAAGPWEVESMETHVILRCEEGAFRGQTYVFHGPAQYLIGRARECALQLVLGPTVSRQHCLLEVEDAGVWVQDLGSMNGTYVNEERIGRRPGSEAGEEGTFCLPPRHLLHSGDGLRVGQETFRVEVAASPSRRRRA